MARLPYIAFWKKANCSRSLNVIIQLNRSIKISLTLPALVYTIKGKNYLILTFFHTLFAILNQIALVYSGIFEKYVSPLGVYYKTMLEYIHYKIITVASFQFPISLNMLHFMMLHFVQFTVYTLRTMYTYTHLWFLYTDSGASDTRRKTIRLCHET